MPKRYSSEESFDIVPRKLATVATSVDLQPGEVLTDLCGKKWKLGKTIGVGGFGKIYLVSEAIYDDVNCNSPYVAKIEYHENGPLFVEINCYLRAAKKEMIEKWKTENNIESLGMPHYVASGSHTSNGCNYRFLVIPRYKTDLESILEQKQKFNLKTVANISIQILDVLRYIHDKGYIHSDIKASNILLERKSITDNNNYMSLRCRGNVIRPTRPRRALTLNLRPPKDLLYSEDAWSPNIRTQKPEKRDQVYLLDYGLAMKYLDSERKHKEFCTDERKAHAGTLLFCSRDAHEGVESRRSDLECLGFNMIYWLTGSLPWMNDLEDPERIKRKKRRCLENVSQFLQLCFSDYPNFLYEYFVYLQNLGFEEKPDYFYCKQLLRKVFKEYGYKEDCKLDFDNLEGWGEKQREVRRFVKPGDFVHKITRIPLLSNVPLMKPKLRQKTKNKKLDKQMTWSKILIDPEIILKRRVKEKKLSESNNESASVNSVVNFDIKKMNPTYAMIEVYNKMKERHYNSPNYKTDSFSENIDGYTPAMTSVYNRMKEKREIEESVKEVRTRQRTNLRKKIVVRPKRKSFVGVKKEPYSFRKKSLRSKKG